MFGYPNTRRRRLGRSRTFEENGEIREYRFQEGSLNLAGVYGRHSIYFPERPLTLNQSAATWNGCIMRVAVCEGRPERETQTASDSAGTLQAIGLRARGEKPNRITPLAGAMEAQPVS